MNKKYYIYRSKKDFKKTARIFSVLLMIAGLLTLIYISFPLISWQIYFSPVFASQDIAVPIPKAKIVNSSTVKSLIYQVTENIGTNYSDAENWFPGYKPGKLKNTPEILSYRISIPKLNIKSAEVTTIDNSLDFHLVNYAGTAIPPNNGNAVIYGHSTLPQLFNPKDYKTIFATLHTLKVEDEISINVQNIEYFYKIFSIIIVDKTDTSIFTQTYDNSYITLVTCTPPGTTWKRLIVKARLQKI